jgi:DNA-binding response OmpR family regulator
MTKTRILIVDDDPKLRTLLRRCFEGAGYAVSEASDLTSARAQIISSQPDLVTLDLQLGEEDGFVVARDIRASSQIPIIMVTGKDDVIDRVVGLELGADDYITKPFHIREVLARVKSVLRRAQHTPTSSVCSCGSACNCGASLPGEAIGFDGMQAIPDRLSLIGRDGHHVALTSGDFQLLQIFLDRPQRVLSRDSLMDMIGGASWTPLDRTIDNRVARLRKKIERDHTNPKLIKAIRGVGYSFCGNIERQVQVSANIA